MRHRADAPASPPRRLGVGGDADRRPDHLAGDVRRIAVAGLHAMVIVTRGHEDDRLAVRRLEDAHNVRRDQRPAREHAEVERLQRRKGCVVALDRHHRLVGLDAIAVVEGVDGQLVPVLRAELENRDRLVHPPEVSSVLLEDLHDDTWPAAVLEQRRPRVVEVRVGVVTLPHLLDGELEDLRRQPPFRRGWRNVVCAVGPRCSPPGTVLSRAHIYGYGRSLRPPQGTTITPRRRATFRQALLVLSRSSGLGSSVASRCWSSWPGFASARESARSGLRTIQLNNSVATPTAPSCAAARAGPRRRSGARAASAPPIAELISSGPTM